MAIKISRYTTCVDKIRTLPKMVSSRGGGRYGDINFFMFLTFFIEFRKLNPRIIFILVGHEDWLGSACYMRNVYMEICFFV